MPTVGRGWRGYSSATTRLLVTTFPHPRPSTGAHIPTPLHGPSRGWAGEPHAYNRGPPVEVGAGRRAAIVVTAFTRHPPSITRRGVGMWAPVGTWCGTAVHQPRLTARRTPSTVLPDSIRYPRWGAGGAEAPPATDRLLVTTFPHPRPSTGAHIPTPLHGPSRGWAGEPHAYNRGPPVEVGAGRRAAIVVTAFTRDLPPTTRRGVS